MKRIIISFDYELFFGKTAGSVYNTLIRPTNLMLDALEHVGAKGSFFVDYLMIKYLREINEERAANDLKMIENQLEDIVKRGHRIELHIHSHWIDAKYNGDGNWDFSNFTHYALIDLPKDVVNSMIDEGVIILTNIVRRADPLYKICAFRAGGWAVQPFSHIKDGLEKNSIFIDSSVAPSMRIPRPNGKGPDFTMIKSNMPYRFTDEIETLNSKGIFKEVPISTYKLRPCEKWRNMLYLKMNKDKFVTYSDGTHSRNDNKPLSRLQKIKDLILYLFMSSYRMYGLTHISPNIINSKIRKSTEEIIVFIDHPKDMSKSNLDVIAKLDNSVKYITYLDC